MLNPNLQVPRIIRSFEFADPTAPERLTYAENLGFLALQQPEAQSDNGLITLVGAPTYLTFTDSGTYRPVTTLPQVPRKCAKPDLLGKGVGTRLLASRFSTAQARCSP